MKNKIAAFVFLLILLVSFACQAEISFEPEKIYDSVFVVHTSGGVGSGFAIDEKLIITNAHVVGENKNVRIICYNGDKISGTVVKCDAEKDLALISVESKLKPIEISDKKAKIGQEVYAIGAPKDMPFTMTKGIISALNRKIDGNSYIQIDASVNSGNSGGPLLSEEGKFLGVITLKAVDAEGIGFAIGAGDASEFAREVDYDAPVREQDNKEASSPADNKNIEEINSLKRQVEALYMIIFVLILIIIVLIIVLIKIKDKKKKTDIYDFEIEIED